MIGPIESDADSSVNSKCGNVKRGDEFGKRDQTKGVNEQWGSAGTSVLVRCRPVGPFPRHRERAEIGISQAQSVNPSDMSNI